MSYATQADLVPRRLTQSSWCELTNDAGGNTVDATNVTNILTEASALVDSYCVNRYTIPLQPSEQVKGLVLDIAVYKLFQRRRRMPQEVNDAYAATIKFLQDVSTEKAGLDQPTGALPQTLERNRGRRRKDERFSDDNLKGFV
jgi:phage gp36-like protein